MVRLFFFIALKLVLITRASKVVNGKKVHLPRLQPRSQVLSAIRSLALRRAGRREPWERGCRGFLLNFGARFGLFLFSFFVVVFFFKFVANKYVINWRVFPTKTHPKGFVSFQTKFLFPYGIICHLEQRQSRNNNNSYKKKESFLSSNSQRSGN